MILNRAKTFNCSQVMRTNFFKEIIFVIQNWIHTTGKTIGFAANIEMRSNRSLSLGLCVDFDNPGYQPTNGGADRQEKEF